MNQPITFVTSNDVKFKMATDVGQQLGFELLRERMDLQEIQSDDGEALTKHKAEQAYATFNRPIVISDDTWSIPGLNGFPGPYMKYMNEWLGADDFLHLTQHLEDRRIILRQHVCYQDARGQQYFVEDIVGTLLPEIRGNHTQFHHLSITSFDGGTHSGAELLAAGKPALDPTHVTTWHAFAAWLARN